MTDDAHNLIGLATEAPPATSVELEQHVVAPRRADSESAAPDRIVYLFVARALLPRWLRILGPAPWLAGAAPPEPVKHHDVSTLYRRQAATLAIAALREIEPRRADRSYLREVVRTSLIHWQLTLRGDGCPAGRPSWRSPLHGAVVANVVRLLSETTGFQTAGLISDIKRHVQWLARRPSSSPWIEAATVCAMADAAVLVRDSSLLGCARGRLERLLAGQTDEGWFPEREGADAGRLSLTVDALARVQRQNNWEELEEPLRRALRFLIQLIHPDGSVGTCHDSCGTGFLPPYGLELLAPRTSEAAALALACRRRCERLDARQLAGLSDDSAAAWGSSLVLAAANARSVLSAPCPFPFETAGRRRFPLAGVSIFATKAYHATVDGCRGGGIHVTWKNGAPSLDDAGITAVFSRRMRTSARFDARTRPSVTDSSVTCRGILRRAGRERRSLWHRLKRWITRIGRRPKMPVLRTAVKDRAHRAGYGRLAHDWYTRDITFGDDWIRIRDRIHCRLPCETIVCQSSLPGQVEPLGGSITVDEAARGPILVDGGRDVEITRLYHKGELVDPRFRPQVTPPGIA